MLNKDYISYINFIIFFFEWLQDTDIDIDSNIDIDKDTDVDFDNYHLF
jgi:hypothetical protein